MSEDAEKAAELRGYSRGYAAGRRRAHLDEARDEARGRREAFRQEVYLAIIAEMIRSPWGKTVNGQWVADKGAKEISATAWDFANEAVKRATFL